MRRATLAVAFALIAFVARVQAQPDGSAALTIAGGTTTVPFTLVDDHIDIDVRLDGRGPYRFALDTGSGNVVDWRVLASLGETAHGSYSAFGVGPRTESFSYATVRTLQAGGLTLSDAHVSVADVRDGFGAGTGEPIDGIVGFEVLARAITTIDYFHRTVTFRVPVPAAASSTPFPNAARPASPATFTLPMTLSGTAPEIACALDGVPGRCQIDTGERGSLVVLAPFVAAHPAIVPARLTAPGVTAFGVGGPASARLGRMRRFTIGDATLHDVLTSYSVATRGFFAGKDLAANVGGGVLRRFTVTIDYPNRTIAFTRNPDFAVPEAHDRSGTFLIRRPHGITIEGVFAGSPAARAGLSRGDRLIAIDGRQANKLSLDAVRALFLRPAGTIVHLDVAEGAPTTSKKYRRVSLVLEDYVPAEP